MSKLLLVDVDDCILQFAKPFEEWLEKTIGVKRFPHLYQSYKIEEWLGCDRQLAVDLMTTFGKADVSYLNRPIFGSVNALRDVREKGYRIVAITACGLDADFAARRTKIIADVFGGIFEGIHYVAPRASKRDVLASFAPAIWVEDNRENALDGAELGHQTFLLSAPYNQGACNKVRRVTDWYDIEKHL